MRSSILCDIQEFVHAILQPVAYLFFPFLVDMGINIHGYLNGRMPQLLLNVLHIEQPGAFHASSHIMAEHMEGGSDTQFVTYMVRSCR